MIAKDAVPIESLRAGRSIRARLGAIGLLVLLLLSPLGGTSRSGHAPAQAGQPDASRAALAVVLERPAPLREGIGAAHEAVTTSSSRAQAYYDQGLAYLHSFVWIEAARAFHQAARLDPKLALAFVGLSHALGELGDRDGAVRAAQQARELAAGASERERLRIDLRWLQLRAAANPADVEAGAAYRRQLDDAAARFTDDVEILLLVGRSQDPSHDAHGMRVGSASLEFYRRALARAPDYFAIHHYLTHAYENLNRLPEALAHASRFAALAPAIPHAHHMFGHVLRRVGRMPEAVEEFRTADDLGAAYLEREAIPPAFDWHYRHNLDLLGTSYQYLGRVKLAEDALSRAFTIESIAGGTAELTRKEWPLFLLARGRAREALNAAEILARDPQPLVSALGQVLASRALAALGQSEGAAEAGNAALRRMKSIGPQGGILVPDLLLAQGEYLLRHRQLEQGRTMILDAVAKLRAASGPDAWIQTLFQMELAARVSREAGDWTLAAAMAEQMREHDPEYAGTFFAAALVAEQRGEAAAARRAFQEAARRWQSADDNYPELQLARERAGVQVGAPAR